MRKESKNVRQERIKNARKIARGRDGKPVDYRRLIKWSK